MRFSLATLVLISLWISLALLVWVWRAPWVADNPPINFHRDLDDFNYPVSMISPDRTRWFDPHYPGFLLVNPVSGNAICYLNSSLNGPWRIYSPVLVADGFLDNDTIAFAMLPDEPTTRISTRRLILRRRFPEWWWGHFYRPEVWAFAVLTVVLVVRAARGRRALRTDSPKYSSPQDMK